MYTQCACCVHAWVDIPTYRDMRGCALCILGCREQTNVFLFILLAGRIGPDELVSSSNSTFFPLPSVFFHLRRRQTNRIQHEYQHLVSSTTTKHARRSIASSSFVDRFTPWNLIHCSFRNVANAMAHGTASLYTLFSTFLRTVSLGRMYKLLSSKISPRYRP